MIKVLQSAADKSFMPENIPTETAMKIIQDIKNNSVQPDAVQKKNTNQPAKEKADSAFTVQLSQKMAQLAAIPTINDEARQAKVAAIRDQLASGNYNISGKDVATKILDLLKS